MNGLRYTLLGDGPSDRLLRHPIRWALRSMQVPVEIEQWAAPSRASRLAGRLVDRIRTALDLYPADLLFVHRDAERVSRDERVEEIRSAAEAACNHHVAVVPVRMTEAWLLHDEAAIRRASGNPYGRSPLELPRTQEVEQIVDPKACLRDALVSATELDGRRRRKAAKDFGSMRARTAELIADFTPLCAAPTFVAFLLDLHGALSALGYSPLRPPCAATKRAGA